MKLLIVTLIIVSFVVGLIGYRIGYLRGAALPRPKEAIDCSGFQMSMNGQDVKMVPDGYFLMVCPESLLDKVELQTI